MTSTKAHATPTKDFFVRMITRDINLEDCILDLIDNSLDGAGRLLHGEHQGTPVPSYEGFFARVTLSKEKFSITDNCGGISLDDAVNYAFHFGRRADAPAEGDYSIGLYGIGMKRAIFKLGELIKITSSTQTEAFSTCIDVPKWLSQTKASQESNAIVEDWDFDLDEAPVLTSSGTSIEISNLHPPVAEQLADPNFQNSLARIIARDYSQFIAKGFVIELCGRMIAATPLQLRLSDEFSPVRESYEDGGVKVEIFAGMTKPPPDDLSPIDARAEAETYGWYVACNDRFIVAGDKSEMTVWGEDGFPYWHYQYNGFIGLVSFHAKDARLLPWTTTKRDVDESNAVYRRAITRMKEVTRAWIKYTGERRVDLKSAKEKESQAVTQSLFEIAENKVLRTPQVTRSPIPQGSIQYYRPAADIKRAKKLLGNERMPNYKVGTETFEYFLRHEGSES